MRALPIVLLMAACSGAPTQPTNATAVLVEDLQGISLSLCAVGHRCSLNGRLRNIGAGCAQSISVTVTIAGVVYTSPITVAGSITRPNVTVPFQIEVPYAERSEMQIGATWSDIPCPR